MRVRIVKTTKPDAWYSKFIGIVFSVGEDYTDGKYYMRKDGFGFIRKDDCEIVEEIRFDLDPKLFEV